MSDFVLAFDGSCGPKNPGPFGAYGFIIHKDGVLFYEESTQMERGETYSNNHCEFFGLYRGLEKLREIVVFSDRVFVRGDSKLVINMMNRRFKPSPGKIYYPAYVLASESLTAIRRLFIPVSIDWVPREMNQQADKLSKYKR